MGEAGAGGAQGWHPGPVLLIISSEVMRWAAQLGSNGLDFGLYLRPDPPSAPGRLAWGLAGTLVQPVPCLRGRGWGGAGRGMRVAQAPVFRGGPFAESTEGRQ